MKLFQITEEDLQTLERILPEIADVGVLRTTPRLRVQLVKVQKILSDVRWNYGPHTDITIIPAGDGGEPTEE